MQTFAFSAIDTFTPAGAAGNASTGSSGSSAGGESSFASHLATQSAKHSTGRETSSASTADRPKRPGQPAAESRIDTPTPENSGSDALNGQEQAIANEAAQPAAQNGTDAPDTANAQPADNLRHEEMQEVLTPEDADTLPAGSEAQIFLSAFTSVPAEHNATIAAAPETDTSNTSTVNAGNQSNGSTHSDTAAMLLQKISSGQYQLSPAAAAETGKQVTLTAAQLQQVIDSVTAKAPEAASQQAPAAHENGRQVVVKQWSASFSNTQAETRQTAQNAGVQQAGLINNSPQVTAQTAEGQVITVYQSTVAEQTAANTMASGKALTTDPSGRRQDNTSNYIHSNLPNNTVKTVLAEQEQQLADDAAQQNSTEKSFAGEQLNKTETIFRSDPTFTPLNFDSLSSSNPTASQTATANTTMMRLPSGTIVPESAVMDQVVQYFNGSRKLESGSVTLSLHPRELGELRMEIKVDQDNIRAHITAQTPQAQEALDKHLPRLREALEQQGLFLNEVEISIAANSEYDGSLFQQNEERHQLGKSYRTSSASSQDAFTLTGEEEEDSQSAEDYTLRVTA